MFELGSMPKREVRVYIHLSILKVRHMGDRLGGLVFLFFLREKGIVLCVFMDIFFSKRERPYFKMCGRMVSLSNA